MVFVETEKDWDITDSFCLLPLLHDDDVLGVIADDGLGKDHGSPDQIMFIPKCGTLELVEQAVSDKHWSSHILDDVIWLLEILHDF